MDQIPAAMDRHLDVLRCHQDGGLLLGASSLTGRYWLGSLWYYKSPDQAPDVEKCTAGVQLEAGLRDAQWADAHNVLVGLDTGGIALWELVDDFHTFTMSQSSLEHDNIVSSVSLGVGSQQAVSGSYDRNIKVWDLTTLSSTHTYRAHTDVVWSVVCHSQDPNVFLSCSQDGRVLLWDPRKAKPASIVDKGPLQYSPTSASWHPYNDHIAAVADESGAVVIKDIRRGVDFVTSYMPHTSFVHQIDFCPDKSNLLASIGDDCRTVIVSLDGLVVTELLSEMTHTDFARGLAWNGADRLLTCGWDGCVQTHCVSSANGWHKSLPGEVPAKVDEVMDSGRISYSAALKASQG